jgi:hypothetical protein
LLALLLHSIRTSNLLTYSIFFAALHKTAHQTQQLVCFCIARLQARLAGPVADLLQAHGQSVDPNLLALSEAWQQAEAALAAQGKSVDQLAAAAAGSDDDEGEEEHGGAAAAGQAGLEQLPVPEDLQVRFKM